MTTSTATLADFLLARIAEDESVAKAAMNVPEGVERTASLPRLGPSVHVPVSDAPDAPEDEIGHWGWHGGPVEADSDPESIIVKAFGPIEAEPDRPYVVGDSGLWDESEPVGAEYFRATIPAGAGEGTAQHIARHDPARVLAECEAKRRIVEHCDVDHLALSPGDPYVLRLLALPYADHPDFREEWRP